MRGGNVVGLPTIRFESVSKRFDYAADRPQTILDTLVSAARRKPARSGRGRELWAIRDVSFDIAEGDSLGIIGRNGSGKSTVLKLASGIIRPTSGRVLVRGRLSALLELGAGFHPELTGEENVYLNGSILGMTAEEVAGCYDSILQFSGLGDFINMPVKHYSSGMYMRLGFSVAVHVDPDILLVDEILAVGDQAFQNKCIDKIDELRRGGTSIVFVSHNLETVRTLCSKLIWVDSGAVRASGAPDEVIRQYLDSQEGYHLQSHAGSSSGPQRWGSRDIELTRVRLLDASGSEQDLFAVGKPMTIELHYEAHRPVTEPEFGLAFFRQDGVYVSGPDNRLAGLHLGTIEGSGVLRYHVEQLPLLPARYKMTATIYGSQGATPYDHHEKAYSFRVLSDTADVSRGIVELPARWEWSPEEKQLSQQDAPPQVRR